MAQEENQNCFFKLRVPFVMGKQDAASESPFICLKIIGEGTFIEGHEGPHYFAYGADVQSLSKQKAKFVAFRIFNENPAKPTISEEIGVSRKCHIFRQNQESSLEDWKNTFLDSAVERDEVSYFRLKQDEAVIRFRMTPPDDLVEGQEFRDQFKVEVEAAGDIDFSQPYHAVRDQ